MLEKIKLREVKGFNPEEYLVDYTSEATGEVVKRLPFAAQLCWFHLYFPNGRTECAVERDPDDPERFIARAKVWADRADPEYAYLASGEQSRRVMKDRPEISPRVSAQTAALSLALRYAGFGCQFDLAGDEPEGADVETPVPVEEKPKKKASKKIATVVEEDEPDVKVVEEEPVKELSYDEMPEDEAKAKALGFVITSGRYAGQTLGDILTENKGYIAWVVEKYEGSEKQKDLWNACKFIDDYARRLAK